MPFHSRVEEAVTAPNPAGEERLRAFMDAPGCKAKPYNYTVHSDFLPRKVEVTKSTVLLMVAGIPWNSKTEIVIMSLKKTLKTSSVKS
jgi:hypothetical protein